MPVDATVIGTDYSEAERLADKEPFAWLRPRPITDTRSGRPTKVRIRYADATGAVHQAVVKEVVTRGKTVKPDMRVFYDRRDPDRVDRNGAAGAIVCVILWGVLLAFACQMLAATGG